MEKYLTDERTRLEWTMDLTLACHPRRQPESLACETKITSLSLQKTQPLSLILNSTLIVNCKSESFVYIYHNYHVYYYQ